MRNLMLIIAGIWLIQLFGVKGELGFVIQDVDIPIVNEEYIKDVEAFVNDDIEPAIVCNFTIIKQFPDRLTGRFILIGASMGEYVVPTGIDYKMDFCDMFDEPIIMIHVLRAFGFEKENCPPGPGVYGTEGFVMNTETLPDSFPSNKYLVVFEINNSDDNTLYLCHIYMRVF